MKKGLVDGAMKDDDAVEEEGAAHEAAESKDVEASEQDGETPDNDEGEAEGGDAGTSDPAYKAAMDLVMQTFYKDGGARDIAQALKTAQDPVDTMANLSYDTVTAVDEKTGGKISEEMLGAFACQVLGEVADIGEAAGVKLGGKQVAEAVKIMLTRYATDNGIDSQQLQQAMSTVNTDQLGQHAEQQAGAM